MGALVRRVDRFLNAYFQILAAAIGLTLAIDMMVAVKQATPPTTTPAAAQATTATPGAAGSLPRLPGTGSASGAPQPGVTPTALSTLSRFQKDAGHYVPGVGTIPLGIDFKNKVIKLAYYWKGYDAATAGGASGNQLDEGLAFWRFVQYVNAHANDSPTRDCSQRNSTCFMGFPFNLHGFRLDDQCVRKTGSKTWGPCVAQAGEDTNGWAQVAVKISDVVKPFAAVSSHGGLSDYGCPILADAHIFNPVTYSVYEGLTHRTNGYCMPQGVAWENQVKLVLPWLKRQNQTPGNCASGTVGCSKRSYGILFAEYQGEHESVQKFAKALVAAGVNLAKSKSAGIDGYSIYSVSVSLTNASQQVANIVTKFRADGVNEIIAPDSGAEISFTHAAEAAGYTPDYFVWPCSGEDAEGQVRLYDPHQWTRASGMSCYDSTWYLDLNLDDTARASQWFRQYQEIACPGGSNCSDPPSTAPLVYEGMLPVLAGLTKALPDITMESFFAGLHGFDPYRYDGVNGRSRDPSHFLVTMDRSTGDQIGDVTEVKWNPQRVTSGNTTPGGYDYGSARYPPGYQFSG